MTGHAGVIDWYDRVHCPALQCPSRWEAIDKISDHVWGQTRLYGLAPALFCVAIDWILNHMAANPGIKVGSSFFTDLVYADDTIAPVSSRKSVILPECRVCPWYAYLLAKDKGPKPRYWSAAL